MPSTRTYRVKFLGVWPATSVMLNGASVSYEASSGTVLADTNFKLHAGNSWTYEGTTLSLIVDIQTSQKTTSSTTLKIAFSQSLQSSYLQADYKRSLNVLQQCKDMLDEQWPVYYPDDYDSLLVGSQVGVNMTTTSVYTDLPRLKTLYSQVKRGFCTRNLCRVLAKFLLLLLQPKAKLAWHCLIYTEGKKSVIKVESHCCWHFHFFF